MHVHGAQARDRQHFLGQDLPEGGCHAQVGRKGAQRRDAVHADAPGLVHFNAALLGPFLGRRRLHSAAAPLGLVRLGEHGAHTVTRALQRVEGSHRVVRRAHEDNGWVAHVFTASSPGSGCPGCSGSSNTS